jgi:hypothetical protein
VEYWRLKALQDAVQTNKGAGVRSFVFCRRLPLATAAILTTGLLASSPAFAKTFYVSASKGKDTNACTAHKPCATISGAVTKANNGSRVQVGRGTYDEMVTITKRLKLIGTRHVTINATGQANAVLIEGAGAAGTLVQGITAENAQDEGILAMGTSRVNITHDTVKHNDLGVAAANPTGECAAAGGAPGDCGEGLHLWAVAHSKVTHDIVKDDSGGILLTDETGPTHGNLISHNTVTGNAGDCGITVASHNGGAYVNGQSQPTVGGIYRNVISHNQVNRNGLQGQGAGILMAGAFPGTAVYDNTVKDNVANDNGLGGFTLHSHSPGQDLNGNRIIDNSFKANGQNGGNGQPGDSDFGITNTVGIVIASAATPLTGTVVKGNHISHDFYGIWTMNVPTIKKRANHFKHIVVDVHQQ